ncbi:BadF/BadG/BcrA/BcrD ATPase family protein [Aquisphaera giovannonii]|uniref:BadF/BadG/BcrA/BcrD ATPase family protein n=1 Tax=Aquisphaera giovannonii TaxID=406548 RepID=A0A5B9WDV3_9BACT|nr:BadF/BadG/BcrA/BcrD ATPase family protein [Aquisphaera giovannonii]QEH38080.1 BadF/BadG/BcrA/BcrD ATPase family protein [Aquisphaera giovannonii]
MSPGEPLLLGIDGGGTSTVALLGRGDGTVLGRGRAGPSNANAVGEEAARAALEQSIAGAFADAGRERSKAAVACLGLAGFDRPEDKELLRQWSESGRWANDLILGNDGDLVVAAGTPEGFGVGVIAGTGSIAVVRAPGGRSSRSGGWGHLLGDEGSAYAVVLAALRSIARRADGRESPRRTPDPLTRHLCDAMSIPGPEGLVRAIYAPGMDRTRIASLAPAVLAAADEDPSIADVLLRPAGRELALMASAAARAVGWEAGRLDVALAGGFLLSSRVVRESLLDGLRAEGYDPAAMDVPEPAAGALVLARRRLGSP